jgi:uncharacterized membrane protein YfcA
MARPVVLARNATSRVVTLLAAAVRLVAAIIGGLILVYAVFVLFKANPSNPLVSFTGSIRNSFGWFTKNLFSLSNANISEAINAAIAGLIYVVVGSFLSKLIVRFAPAPKK